MSTHGKIVYLEIPAADVATSAAFYQQVFAGEPADAATARWPSTMLIPARSAALGASADPRTATRVS
jgi:predicted enzyme related to lactoylglutathione lyase